MLKKLNYRPEYQYGVLTGIKRNVIVVEKEGDTVAGFDTAKELQDHVKANKVPVRTGPIYQHICDAEEMKKFVRDSKMDKQIDLRQSLDGMKECICRIMEPAKEVVSEKLLN